MFTSKDWSLLLAPALASLLAGCDSGAPLEREMPDREMRDDAMPNEQRDASMPSPRRDGGTDEMPAEGSGDAGPSDAGWAMLDAGPIRSDAASTGAGERWPMPSCEEVDDDAPRSCIHARSFGSGERDRFRNRDAERVFGPFAEVTNGEGRFFEQDIWDHGSPGEHQRIEADGEHLYFRIPEGRGGSNGNDDASGGTFHIALEPASRATLRYDVRFEGEGFDDGDDIQVRPCEEGPGGAELHDEERTCLRGGKLPGLGLGDDPRTGCRHADNGGSLRVMFMDMDGAGSSPPEFISYAYTQGTPVAGDPEEGSDRGSTPDPSDRCGTQRSLSPPVFVSPGRWYRVVVEVAMEDATGRGTYSLEVYDCDDEARCDTLLGALSRPANFLDEGTHAVTQLLMHAYTGGAMSDPHWRLPADGDIVLRNVVYTSSLPAD